MFSFMTKVNENIHNLTEHEVITYDFRTRSLRFHTFYEFRHDLHEWTRNQ